MAYDEQLAERVRESFKHHQTVSTERRMMGGLCFMVDGKMCVGVEKGRLMVRLDPAVYDRVLKRKGCSPMDFTGRPMKGFVFVNSSGYSSERDLQSWLQLALEFNPKAKSSKRK